MIKEFIKHQIYDTCIELFFSAIEKNFSRSRKGDSIPHVGEFYRLVSHNYGDEHYHNCFVKSIEYRGTDASHYCIVYITYEYSTGKDIIGLNEVETYLNNNDIKLDSVGEDEEDDVYSIAFGDETNIKDLFENDDIEFLESDGVMALNSKYYVFYK